MKLTSDDRVGFAQAVWSTFQHQAKTKRDMSSAEFVLVGRWLDQEIPLPVVLRGITEFEGTPRRLEACEAAVDRAFGYYRQAMAL